MAASLAAQPVLVLDQPTDPPSWALAERLLLETASDGVQAFFDRFVDDRGYLKCVERWGGNDGGR